MMILGRIFFAVAATMAVPLALAQGHVVAPEDLVGHWAAATHQLHATFLTELSVRSDQTFEKIEKIDGTIVHQSTGTWQLFNRSGTWRYQEKSPTYKPNDEGKQVIDFDIQYVDTGKAMVLLNRRNGELVDYKRQP